MMDNIDELFLLYPLHSRLQVSPVILAFLDFLYDVARRHDVSPKGGVSQKNTPYLTNNRAWQKTYFTLCAS